MMNQLRNEKLLTSLDAREYFHDAVKSAVINQGFHASDESIVYIVNMLVSFLRSENLFDKTPDGIMIKPLAMIYGEALSASSETDRLQTLRRLGDIALFISGLYANSLSRCLVDVDYYISMGGSAYSCVADSHNLTKRFQGMKLVFDELSGKFGGYVEVLSEVGEESNISGSTDIMRLYELWQCTGSKRLANKLQGFGIHPISTCRTRH